MRKQRCRPPASPAGWIGGVLCKRNRLARGEQPAIAVNCRLVMCEQPRERVRFVVSSIMKIDYSAFLAGLLVPAFAAAQPAPPTPSPSPSEAPAPAPSSAPAVDQQPAPGAPAGPAAAPAGSVSAAPSAAPAVPEVAPAPRALDRRPAVRIGGELALLPLGTLTVQNGSNKASFDSQVTLGVGGVLQIPLNDVFTIDFAPRLVFNVKSDNDTDSGTELDLRARLTAGGYVAPKARLYAALQPGYSFLFVPSDPPAGVEMSTPSGLTFGVAAGAMFRVSAGVHLTTEIGYQFGFQSTTINAAGQSIDLDVTSSFLHLAGGVLLDL
jgi:hypothetical protein